MNNKCMVCGKTALNAETSDFNAEFKDDSGVTRKVIVPNVTKLKCSSCGEVFLDQDSEERISAAQRRALGLLDAGDLVNFRKQLGKSQEAMAKLLGLGKKTYCRWESNDYFQSEAFDRYLRLLMFTPSIVQALEMVVERKNEGGNLDSMSQRFPYVRDIASSIASGREFLTLLEGGPFAKGRG